MAVEQAQRLIAMSLGKIAHSRGQRGGANLHKSLLVSTVLHKARTTIMMESFQAMMQRKTQQVEVAQRMESEEERPATPAPCVGPPPAVSPVATPEQPRSQWDKENTFPTVESPKEYHVLQVPDRPSPLQTSTTDNIPEKSCAKCLKRRSSEILDSEISAKRCKYESDNELSSDISSSRSDCVFASENSSDFSSCGNPEPMQTEPVQISSLVQRFNTGLSGLLSPNSGNNNDFSSCCKDNQLDSLSRPCIAV